MGNSAHKEFGTNNLSAKEIKKLQNLIKKKKGKKGDELNLSEFKDVFTAWLGKRGSDLEKVDLEEIFHSVDTDHSGTVNTKELVAWLSVYQKGSVEEKLTAIFQSFDTDGNGTLSKDEMQNVLDVLQFSMTSRGLTESRSIQSAQERITKETEGGRSITLQQWIQIGKETNIVEDLLGKDFVRIMS